MTKTSTPRVARFDDLAAGDVITAVDGQQLDRQHVVEGTRRGGAIRLVRPDGTGIEWWLYEATADTFTVQRPAPVEPTDDNLVALATRMPRIPWSERPGDRQVATDPRPGDVVIVPGEYWRAGIVLSVGPKRVRVAYTTPHGATRARDSYVRITRPYYQRSAVYSPLASDTWAAL